MNELRDCELAPIDRDRAVFAFAVVGEVPLGVTKPSLRQVS